MRVHAVQFYITENSRRTSNQRSVGFSVRRCKFVIMKNKFFRCILFSNIYTCIVTIKNIYGAHCTCTSICDCKRLHHLNCKVLQHRRWSRRWGWVVFVQRFFVGLNPPLHLFASDVIVYCNI